MTLVRPSIFGGSWINGSNSGSRYANLDNWPENSNDNLSARGASDDPFPTRRRSRPRRSSSTKAAAPRAIAGWSARFSGLGEHIARSGTAGSSGDMAVETRDRR